MRRQESILVIEDEPNLRRTLVMILRQAGYAVTAVDHSEDALRSIDAQAYDLIFLDVDHIEFDGADLLATIYRLRPTISLLILTASPAIETIDRSNPIGRQACLIKPIDPSQMLACIRNILDRPMPSPS